jgi:hypothetical protein
LKRSNVLFSVSSSLVSLFIDASLTWESYEQINLWSFIVAELTNLSSYSILSIRHIMYHLKIEDHPETFTGLFNLLRSSKPSVDIVKEILAQDLIDIFLEKVNWDECVEFDTSFEGSCPLSYWICTVICSWLDMYSSEIQIIFSNLILLDTEMYDSSTSRQLLVHSLDVIYFWFLYQQQHLLSETYHLVNSSTLIDLIWKSVCDHKLGYRYPQMESFLKQLVAS